jgi:magnesium chelatase family protein
VLAGLPEAAVKESTHREERAMVNSGFQRPQSRLVDQHVPGVFPSVKDSPTTGRYTGL